MGNLAQFRFIGAQGGGVAAVACLMEQVARGGKAGGPGLHGFTRELAHFRAVGGGGRLMVEGAFAHDIYAQRRMRQQHGIVDIMRPALYRGEIFANAFPVPRQAG